MKKLLNISVIAALAILPLAANAAPVTGDPKNIATETPTGQTAENVTASAAPKYQLAEADSNVDGVVATAGYVKGAYNAAIKAINKVSDVAATAATGASEAAQAAVQDKLDNGETGYDIDAKTLKVQGKDVLTVDNTKTVTNKTIDADSNTISNLEADNFKSGVVRTSTDAIRTDGTAVDTSLVTEKAVAAALASATNGQVTLNGTQTLTGKTIDADDNTIQDLTTNNFKTGTVVTTVGATGADTSLPTEKAVRSAISTATSNLATQTGAAATAKAAVNGATVTYSLAGLGVSTGAVGGTATVPVMAQWGDTSTTTSVEVDLTGTTAVTGLTGNTSGLTATIAAANNVTYTAGE